MNNLIEFIGGENTIKIALQNPKATFVFLQDWNGEKYSHYYKFDKNKIEFIEIEAV